MDSSSFKTNISRDLKLEGTLFNELSAVIFPSVITPGIAGFMFSMLETVVGAIGGILFLYIVKSLLTVRFIPLPKTLDQAIVTAGTLITRGQVGGLPSFFQQIACHICTSWRSISLKSSFKQRLYTLIPLTISFLLICCIGFVNLSQISMETVTIFTPVSTTVSLPKSGWIMPLKDGKQALFTGEVSSGSYSITSSQRYWTMLGVNGYNSESNVFVRDGIVCHRAKGFPDITFNNAEQFNESIALCEGYTATCAPFEDMEVEVRLSQDTVTIVKANSPSSFRSQSLGGVSSSKSLWTDIPFSKRELSIRCRRSISFSMSTRGREIQ